MGRLIYTTLILVFISSVLPAQKIRFDKTAKVDTTKTISEKELVKIADKFFQAFYKQTYGEEKLFVDAQLRRLKSSSEDPAKVSKELSAIAVYFTATGDAKAASVIFSSAAVKEAPNDTLIVNNFGAILRMLDSTHASLKVLLYAKSLYPDAPVILTNLGNSLFELFDDKSAEYFYNRALKINPDFAYARQGLFSVYLKRKNLSKALDELFKSIKLSYSQSLEEVHEVLQGSPKYQQPEKPIGDTPEEKQNAVSENKSGSKLDVPIDQLYLPPFPIRSDLYSYLNSKSIEKLDEEVDRLKKEALEKFLAEANKHSKMSREQIAKWVENYTKPKRILFNKSEFGMKLLEQYFEDRLKKIEKEYIYDDKLVHEKVSKSMNEISDAFDKKTKEIDKGAQADPAKAFSSYRALWIDRCKKMKNLNQDYFNDWVKLNRVRYDKITDLLHLYWIYCEKYLNQIYDLDKFESLNAKRSLFVLSHYSGMIKTYSFSKMIFGMFSVAALGTPQGNCPDEPAPIEEPSTSADEKINVPKKKQPECPFKEKSLSIALGPCGVSLDCESIGADCAAGLAAAAKWNYKKKETTIFVGVGVKAEFGFRPGPLEAFKGEAVAKAGATFTFNNKSQLIDYGIAGEAGVSGSMGSFSTGGSVNVTATAVTGIDVSHNKSAGVGILSITR